MMRRFATLLWAAVIVSAAFGLYIVKYRVQAIQVEIAEVKKQIETERENLHVVAAEWAYLNRPERLQQLAQKHLQLEPVGVTQIADVDRVPYPHQEVAEGAKGVENASLPMEGE